MEKKKPICCPTCAKPDTWSEKNVYRPFCSKRCKMIDLGGWADESHRIPGEAINPEPGEDQGENKPSC